MVDQTPASVGPRAGVRCFLTATLFVLLSTGPVAQRRPYNLPRDPATVSPTACQALSQQYETIRAALHKQHEACVKQHRRSAIVEAPRCGRSRAASAAYGCETRAACVDRSNALFHVAEEQLAAEDRCSARLGLTAGRAAPATAEYAAIPPATDSPDAALADASLNAEQSAVATPAAVLAFMEASGHVAFAALAALPLCIDDTVRLDGIGATVCTSTQRGFAPAPAGALVMSVDPNSAASDAGLLPGDTVQSAAGTRVLSAAELQMSLSGSTVRRVAVGVQRGRHVYLIRLTIAPNE